MRYCVIKDCSNQSLPGSRKCDDCRNNLSKYGITAPERAAILQAQGGCCKICGNKVAFRQQKRNQDTSAAVDHCHKTNVVRGILCLKCNWGIGHLQDDPALLRIAADYVEAIGD